MVRSKILGMPKFEIAGGGGGGGGEAWEGEGVVPADHHKNHLPHVAKCTPVKIISQSKSATSYQRALKGAPQSS